MSVMLVAVLVWGGSGSGVGDDGGGGCKIGDGCGGNKGGSIVGTRFFHYLHYVLDSDS